MGIKKVTLSSLRLADPDQLDRLYALGSQELSNGIQSVKVSMTQLRGNTAFREWQERNPGKTYEDWIRLLQEPAQTAADGLHKLEKDLTDFVNVATIAENNREKAEKQREIVEELRVDLENGRIATEVARQDSEAIRNEKEAVRIVEEELRKKAESERKSAEIIRQDQEEKRETGTLEAILSAEAATDRLNALSNHRDEIRDGYWWRWNEETGEWYNTGEIAKGNVMYATFDVDENNDLYMFTDEKYAGPGFVVEDENLYVTLKTE